MRKNILFIILLCCFVIPIKVKAAEGVQSISCTYNVGNYAVTYTVNGTGGGGAIISSNSATKIDVNNRTNYNFSTSENPVVANNFIKDSKLVCPEMLYIRYQAGASTNVGVQVSFVKFSDSEAQVPLSRHTDNQKPFITSEITSGKPCQYEGKKGNSSIPITITREGDELKYELTNGYEIQNNEFTANDFPLDKNGTCPTIYIKCGSNDNDKFCSLYKEATEIDKTHENNGQIGHEPQKPTEPQKPSGNSNNNSNSNSNSTINNFCDEEKIQTTFRFLGYLLLCIKIVIPILLIIFGAIDYFKAVTSSNADALSKSTQSFLIRIIAGIGIFLLPTIIDLSFGLIKNSSSSSMNKCRECIFRPTSCK